MDIDRHKCDNCSFMGYQHELISPVPDLEQRVDAGGTMPSGECPVCGALCYQTKEKFPAPVRLLVQRYNDKRHNDNVGYCAWFQTGLAAAEDKDVWIMENDYPTREDAKIEHLPGQECKKKNKVETQAELLKLVEFVYNACETEGCSDGTATISAEAFDRLKAVCED